MKITTEQIKNLSVKHDKLCVVGFARELIALAQEVGELVFTEDEYGFFKYAETPFGVYFIKEFTEKSYYFEFSDEVSNVFFATEEEAKEAAQQDYAKRVLSGLKYGGGE